MAAGRHNKIFKGFRAKDQKFNASPKQKKLFKTIVDNVRISKNFAKPIV